MVYIHATGIHNTIPNTELPDLRTELKSVSGKVYRRSDHFIQLAILGAHKAAKGNDLQDKTAIYMTSGQGNISVFDRVCNSRHIQKHLPKPVDFINLLSNSAGFYVASHLGLNGKNIFLAHHHFPVQMTMLTAQNDLVLGKQKTILTGGVDEWISKQDLAQKLLGVDETTRLGEGSNWILLNSEAEGAVGTFEGGSKCLGDIELYNLLSSEKAGTYLAFSKRFTVNEAAKIMTQHPKCIRYVYEEPCGYYETLPFYVLNSFLGGTERRLIHIDVSSTRSYMVMTVENLRNKYEI